MLSFELDLRLEIIGDPFDCAQDKFLEIFGGFLSFLVFFVENWAILPVLIAK